MEKRIGARRWVKMEGRGGGRGEKVEEGERRGGRRMVSTEIDGR